MKLHCTEKAGSKLAVAYFPARGAAVGLGEVAGLGVAAGGLAIQYVVRG